MKQFLILKLFVLSLIFTCCQSQPGANSIKLTPQVFQDSLNQKPVQLIDVRTANEFNTGHIDNALNFDFKSDEFKKSIAVLDTSKSVFIYCRSGKRSAKSVAAFKALGFKNIYELEGGISHWSKINNTVNK
ncbi:rhodanese-like domain-containing protein [Algibacter amylolyticus]|uniref:Rhodanese-like domain-containing protein n=1 Tax=Algibacter amylolyticus TaxID=1608400 RepID=A0A5M7B3A5_9FLAO|nr:rhodanese-like domain-containing protein [Algibacter amylolyticus]KAA5824076.1 rhodanese-like domain-containing protein [Algibacter amylolyticus]MBB5269632.1 rhodanese-related sulfurtransferase [Algibacter amylolyticus]TSJ74553.1 rhodanese-like domain-containing protein [Algibacter amylolyticus]